MTVDGSAAIFDKEIIKRAGKKARVPRPPGRKSVCVPLIRRPLAAPAQGRVGERLQRQRFPVDVAAFGGGIMQDRLPRGRPSQEAWIVAGLKSRDN